MSLKPKIFSFYTPEKLPLRGILSIPHSGEWIPDEFKPHLTSHRRDLDQDLDYRVNELVDIESLTQNGIAVIESHIHRVCVDINRAPDTAVFAWKDNTQGVKLVLTDPDQGFIERAIGRYHAPYFELLKGLVEEGSRKRNSPLPVIDLHSMPSAPTAYHLKKNPHQKKERDDFCLSDLKGTSCEPAYLAHIKKLFTEGHTASINDPYFGGYVTQFFHSMKSTNAIQIEINRKIYMDEQHLVLHMEDCKKLKSFITKNLLEIYNQS